MTNGLRGPRRRAFLAGSAALGASALSGCLGLIDGDDESSALQIGSGRYDTVPDGTLIEDLPDLAGELTVYSGRGEFLVGTLVDALDRAYDDFTPLVDYSNSADLTNRILTEGSGSQADVFWTVDAGALGRLADEGRTVPLSGEVREMVREAFSTDDWVGISGRARTVPYNTDAYDADEIPDDVMAFPDFDGDLGWAPSYGSCQGFVTAMRILEGEEATRAWLEGVLDAGIRAYPDEVAVTRAVANGEIDAGFANHYYSQRHLADDPGAPLGVAFTAGDAGSVFDVAGAAVVDTADDPELAENFVRHLLSAEAQHYFAVETQEYPLVPGSEPAGDLPPIDELDVPDLDLTRLSDVQPTIDLMRDVGIDT